MGYMRHHAIIVSSPLAENLSVANDKAIDIFGTLCSMIIDGIINGAATFIIAPDGSKEGWADSKKHEDGSGYVDWVEISFADDHGHARILNES